MPLWDKTEGRSRIAIEYILLLDHFLFKFQIKAKEHLHGRGEDDPSPSHAY